VSISGPLKGVKSSRAEVEGEVKLKIKNERKNEVSQFELKSVVYDKNLRRNLMSVRRLTQEGLSVLFVGEECFVLSAAPEFKEEDIILHGALDESKLYTISNKIVEGKILAHSLLLSNNSPLTLKDLHVRLGHLPIPKILEMIQLGQIDGDQVKREENDVKLECEICSIAKMNRKNFAPTKSTKAEKVGDAIHSDLCGPLPPTLGKNIYFTTYVDEKSDYIMFKCIKEKSDNIDVLKSVREEIKTQAGVRMKKLVSDGGGEYISGEVKEYLENKGIIQQLTPPDTPQLNGRSERLNRTLMNNVRAMLREKKLPYYFWGEALRWAIFLRNRMSKKGEKKSRFEVFRKRKLTPFIPEVFGSVVYFKNNSKKKKKLDERARKGIFVGMNEDGTYRIYDMNKRVLVRSRDVKFFQNAALSPWDEIDEKEEMLYLEEERKEIENEKRIARALKEVSEEEEEEDEEEEEREENNNNNIPPLIQQQQQQQQQPVQDQFIQQPRQQRRQIRQQRQERVSSRLGDSRYPNRRANIQNNINNNANNMNNGANNMNNNANNIYNNANDINDNANNINNNERANIIENDNLNNRNNENIDEIIEAEEPIEDIFSCVAELSNPQKLKKDPRSVAEAMRSEERKEWKKAMNREKESMREMETWERAKVPEGKKVIDAKWVFTTKYDEDGKEVKKKARLVARGDRQTEGVDYKETFAPVTKYQTLRYVISFAHENDLQLHHLDVETAFLNGDLEEDVYMKLPQGFENEKGEREVVKLKKSLYGLKQSPRCWNKKFVSVLKRLGFVQSNADPCLFIKEEKKGERTLIDVFVDDLVIAANDVREIKRKLMNEFKMRDLGKLSWILGMKVERSKDKIEISQEAYTNSIIEKFGMKEAKIAPTPLPSKIEQLVISKESKVPFNNIKRYQQIIGALIYLSNTIRPDITFSVNFLARKMSEPSQQDYLLAKRILRYLKGTADLKLTFDKKNKVVGYSDASYAEDKNDRKSTGGYVFNMNGGAISWKSQKQKIVTLSSCEAEYVTLSEAAKEAMWLRKLIRDVDNKKSESPIIIFEDNQSTIKTAKNPIQSERTKHIDVRHHYIRERVEEKKIEVKYVPTTDQVADLLTKSLGRVLHMKFTRALGLK
jgi:hypothetical protein